MNRIFKLSLAIGIALSAFLCNTSFAQYVNRPITGQRGTTGARPNIVIFCADGLGYSDLGCYGSEIKTPAIDKIAAQGIRLTNFYNCGSAVPTRASLLTGQYPHVAGIGHQLDNLFMPGYYGTLNKEVPTLAEILQDKANYQTLMVGRWALSRDLSSKGPTYNWPTNRGFDQFYGTLAISDNQFNPSTLRMQDKPYSATGREFYYTSGIARVAGDFLEQADKSTKPFFLYVSFPAPFMPLHVPTSELRSQAGNYSAGWEETRNARFNRMRQLHIVGPMAKLTPRDKDVPDWHKIGAFAQWQTLRMEMYAAQVAAMDDAVGRIMQDVDRTKNGHNTIVIFLSASGASDVEIPAGFNNPKYMSAKTRGGLPVIAGNNPRIAPGTEKTYQSYGTPWANVSNTPFRGYSDSTYEGGISSPCIIKYPKIINPGRVSHQIVHTVDIVPTILDILEMSYPRQVNGMTTPPTPGVSFMPLFQQKTFTRDTIYWEYKGNIALRQGKWKLVAQYNPKGEELRQWELYDLEKDRAESKNLVNEFPAIAKQMYQMYVSWSKKNYVQSWATVSQKLKESRKKAAANIRRE